MEEYPRFPDHDLAKIEREREAVIAARQKDYPILFEREISPFDLFRSGKPLLQSPDRRPPRVMPATLRIELRTYTQALFSAEARTLVAYTTDENILHSWLKILGNRIYSEVQVETVQRGALHSVHCSLDERLAVIKKSVEECTEQWIKNHRDFVAHARKYYDQKVLELSSKPQVHSMDRRALRDAYRKQFPDAKLMDICWAAGQHYSEWKRWLRGPSVLKDGSAPDKAFRGLLTSGKSPREYRKAPRPQGWK